MKNIAAMREQLKMMGLSLDWSREFATCDVEYYHQQQKLFLDFYNAGFVYRSEADVNWDPVDMTVLANEQVIDGRGWRSGAIVERRKLSQWFFKITQFADEAADRPGWVGPLAGKSPADAEETGSAKAKACASSSRCRTTKSWMSLPPGPTLCSAPALSRCRRNIRWRRSWQKKNSKLAAFIEECRHIGTAEADIEKAEKRGYDTGLTAAHPFDADWKLPVMVANFVLIGYGTGAIFGCPAHDQRDLDFARKYGLNVPPVVVPSDADPKTFGRRQGGLYRPRQAGQFAFPGRHDGGTGQVRSGGGGWKRAGIGERTTNYRLRDWLVSRQRPWGCPIPVIPLPKMRRGAGAQRPVAGEAARGDQTSTSRAIRWMPTWYGRTSPVPPARVRRYATPTLWTRLRIPPGTSPSFTDPSADAPVNKAAADYWLAGGPVYRRHRACHPAPAVCALFHPRHVQAGHGEGGGAVCPRCSPKAW